MITLAQAKAAVKRWQTRLGLREWHLAVELRSGGEEFTAACSAMPEYRRATIVFDPQLDPAHLDTHAAHEVAHCLIWPLSHLAETFASGDGHKLEAIRVAEEGLATDLERTLVRLAGTRTAPTPAPRKRSARK